MPVLDRYFLMAAAAAGLTASLGVWQLQRAQTKQTLQAARDAGAGRAALVSLQGAEEHRHAVLRGEWQPEQQLWLGNRPHDRQSGFILVTPLRLQDGRWLWVQRGWHPRSQASFDPPPWPPTPAGQVSVRGRLARQASQVLALGEAAGAGGKGALRQNLDPAVSPVAGAVMAPWVLWQLDDCAPLRCDWAPVDAGVAKHHGYAAQWFALSALSMGLYVWFRILPRRRQVRS
ncbi:MAG: SURF1 family protein [Burkholderiales bacterium]|nr:SURF1 family protein [Burkholderiales bacterium]